MKQKLKDRDWYLLVLAVMLIPSIIGFLLAMFSEVDDPGPPIGELGTMQISTDPEPPLNQDTCPDAQLMGKNGEVLFECVCPACNCLPDTSDTYFVFWTTCSGGDPWTGLREKCVQHFKEYDDKDQLLANRNIPNDARVVGVRIQQEYRVDGIKLTQYQEPEPIQLESQAHSIKDGATFLLNEPEPEPFEIIQACEHDGDCLRNGDICIEFKCQPHIDPKYEDYEDEGVNE